ncbi:hypothetical protein SDC9_127572 [bioreactor metagenome]|uniref:Uncharacterized protein n=1 Tax=bioreactor metagenome TaxID=1076179 RepID=A0A645CUF8_9ZZZZ
MFAEAEQQLDRAPGFQLVIHRDVGDVRQVGDPVEEHRWLSGRRQFVELFPTGIRFIQGEEDESVEAFAAVRDEVGARGEDQPRVAGVAGASRAFVDQFRILVARSGSGDADVQLLPGGRSVRMAADDRADPRLPHDQPLRFEQTQRLPHRKAAGVVLAAKLVFRRQRGSRREVPLPDLPRQIARHLFENRNSLVHESLCLTCSTYLYGINYDAGRRRCQEPIRIFSDKNGAAPVKTADSGLCYTSVNSGNGKK